MKIKQKNNEEYGEEVLDMKEYEEKWNVKNDTRIGGESQKEYEKQRCWRR